MAVDMRALVGDVIEGWKKGGFELGFGLGIAQGFATMGRIGFEGRYDYASVGSVSIRHRGCATRRRRGRSSCRSASCLRSSHSRTSRRQACAP